MDLSILRLGTRKDFLEKGMPPRYISIQMGEGRHCSQETDKASWHCCIMARVYQKVHPAVK